MFVPSITKEDLRLLPTCQFEGVIHLVDTLEKALYACDKIRHEKFLGFDTETKPSFTKGKVNKVALLQLSTSTDAYIFKLHKIELPEKLIKILAAPEIIKVGAAIHDDIRHLKRIKPFRDAGFIDLQSFVKQFGIENSGLSKMAGIVLKCRISKSQQLSNWESDVFTESQLLYAATDAWAALKIYVELLQSTE